MDIGRLDHMPAVKSVMTPFPWCVGPDAPLADALELMAEHGIRHLPVLAAGRPVGVVRSRDLRLLQAAERRGAKRFAVRDARVEEAYVVELSTPLDRVVREMALRHQDAALVVKEGRVAGIFTASDACRWFGRFLALRYPTGPGDEAA